jgi:hypothetical protein
MIESPLIQEIVAKAYQKGILRLLERRFTTISPQLASLLGTVMQEDTLLELNFQAATCPSLEAFQALLTS